MDMHGGWFESGLEKDVEIEPDIIPGDGEGIAVGEKAREDIPDKAEVFLRFVFHLAGNEIVAGELREGRVR
jgi:hypothetical protein